MKRIQTSWFIHFFALAHAATSLVCSLAGVPDSLFLTALTMALAVVICRKENLTVEITIISLVLVNALGFIFGNLGARLVFDFLPPLWQHAITTFIVTELLGWALYLFAHTVSPQGAAGYESTQSWHKNVGWLIAGIAAVFGFRVYIDLSYEGDLFQESGVIGLLVIVTLLSLAYMVIFALKMQREVSNQRTRRHKAEFSYMNLKNQVNPHFLFNSLNVLDSIVQDGTREEASTYIHKMASIYRYMMQHEGKRLVPVAEEIAFSSNYRDLIQIRFPDGLIIENQIKADVPEGCVPPCTLQLLLENAIKHNAIGPENPLRVVLSSDGTNLTVWNNRVPKVSAAPSSGIGLQYVRNQYRDIAGKEIQVVETPDSFAVSIPILAFPE